MQVWSLASVSGLKIWHCWKLPCRSQMWLGSGVAWLWLRLAAAAPFGPLAQELPFATGVAIKRKKGGGGRSGTFKNHCISGVLWQSLINLVPREISYLHLVGDLKPLPIVETGVTSELLGGFLCDPKVPHPLQWETGHPRSWLVFLLLFPSKSHKFFVSSYIRSIQRFPFSCLHKSLISTKSRLISTMPAGSSGVCVLVGPWFEKQANKGNIVFLFILSFIFFRAFFFLIQISLTSAQDNCVLLLPANLNVAWVALVVFHECNAIIPMEPPQSLTTLTLIKILCWGYYDVFYF